MEISKDIQLGIRRFWTLPVAAVAVSLLLTACGGSDSGADELARQQELAQARKEAAQDARQSATLRQLKRRVNKLKARERGVGRVTTPPRPTTTQQGTPDSDLGDWPGGSGYSAMLGAFSSEANARTRQREATELGLDAGVLYSSNFSSLRPGYWVVFSGAFASQEEAAERAVRAQELGYADSYPRFVSP
jgi:hypothetical protein